MRQRVRRHEPSESARGWFLREESLISGGVCAAETSRAKDEQPRGPPSRRRRRNGGLGLAHQELDGSSPSTSPIPRIEAEQRQRSLQLRQCQPQLGIVETVAQRAKLRAGGGESPQRYPPERSRTRSGNSANRSPMATAPFGASNVGR